MLYPNNASGRLVIDMLFEDEAKVGNILESVLSQRYLNERLPARTHNEFDLGRLFDMRPADFKQSVQTTKSGFVWLLNQIINNAVFHNNSRRPQLPIPHQLALTLERLGSNGNGALVGRFAQNLSVAHGTVVKVSRRVIRAINSLDSEFIVWPDCNRRLEISEVMKEEGFKGCIGFVDGATIPLYQRPGLDGEVYWDRKK
ncbi:hypothetical protein PTTG_01830 [Puccinia triticina 1-1 BBBD Race 1]|uniref:DDE Tnp4 domain-containing protein n=1 Tax=Puccinia triticina (isolate 1-1 / race 1 (BBBD)) TaxID=630390 RepID=A0A0C4EM41_PUCT1|nr:hypothetical protein PTTG_01830 [Puccinia triticina 1-1 BBBD Race 1]